MTDESTLKFTDFDYLTVDHHLQMVKAAIPYVNVTGQRFLSFFVKLRELQKTVSLFQEEQVGAMGICPPKEGRRGTPLEMMKAVRPYGSSQEQDLIDMLCNILQRPYGPGQYSDIAAVHPAGGAMMDDTPPTQIVPDPDCSPVCTSVQPPCPPFAGFPPYEAGAMDTETEKSGVVSQAAVSSPQPALRPIPSPVEQLKGFLPPEQQARLEQAAFVIQALQQFT